MDVVIRHFAYNRVLANGVICGKAVKKLTPLELKSLYYPKFVDYGRIGSSLSDEVIATMYVRPVVQLIPCSDCLNKIKK